MDRPIYDPVAAGNSLTVAPWHASKECERLPLETGGETL